MGLTVLDRIEKFGEEMYRKWWFRLILLLYFFVFRCYVALWVHEFWHYWWGSVIDGSRCYVVYSTHGIRGWTHCDSFSLGNYFIGSVGTALTFLASWFFAASLPSRLTLPYELSLIYVIVNQLCYLPFEVIGLGLGYTWIYSFYWLATLISLIIVAKMYYIRVLEYIIVGDASAGAGGG